MKPELRPRVEHLVQAALCLSNEQRSQFLKENCAGDEELRREVESLLAFGKAADHFLDGPALEMAAVALAKDHSSLQNTQSPDKAGIQGEIIAHYRVLSQLGAGGMGVVYEGEDVRLKRRVALKFAPEHMLRDETALSRIQREARAASSLNHPNICTIYEVEEHQGRPVIVMELLKGKTLKDKLQSGSCPVKEVLDMAVQVADGLTAAHERGIIHRDIKPGNIFLTERGTVKILDFGLAKLSPGFHDADADSDNTLTVQGTTPGTTPYMSPEQVRGEEIDARSDLFSFGIVLYQMATGKRPFQKKTAIATIDAILHERPVTPKALNSSIPDKLDAVIRKALEKDRGARYQHASEMLADLKFVQETFVTPSTFIAGEAKDAKPKAETRSGKSRAPYLVPLRQSGVNAAVIFIHGFSGHPRITWGAFPDALTAYLPSSEWDLFSLAYRSTLSLDFSGIWTADPDLNLLATYLHTALDQPPLDRYERLALIAHSMGGLVVQRALLDHHDLLGRTRNIFLFATPSAGLVKATWVARFKRQWRDLRPESSFITNLRSEWEQKFGTSMPFELIAVAGDRDEFVPAASCFASFPASCCAVVPGNHLEIVKPASASELSIQLVVKRLMVGSETAGQLNESPQIPSLVELPPHELARGKRPIFVTASVLVIAIATLFYQYWSHHAGRLNAVRTLTEKDTVVLADFTNSTRDPVFDGTLRQGMSVQLEQSPFLSLVSEERIQQILRLMSQSPNARLTPEIAREICVRSGSAAVLDGSIANLGSQYVLGLQTRNCRTGDVLDKEQAQAASKEEVLHALDQMATKFRSRVGESLTSVEKYDMPLADASTPSLEALKAFSQGWELVYSNQPGAIPLFTQATEIDPRFAMAHAVLGLMYGHTGESALASEHTARAYSLRDRASDKEKYFITAYYEGRTTGNQEKAQQICQAWSRTYPRDVTPHTFLSGFIYTVLGKYERAVEEAQKSIELDPDASIGYYNLASDYLYLDHPKEAEEALRRAAERKVEMSDFVVQRYDLAFLKSDDAAMAHELALAQSDSGAEDWILHHEAFVLAYSGRLRQARKISLQASELTQQAGHRERAALFETGTALREAFFGNAANGKQRASVALELGKDREVEYGAGLALALAGDSSRAQALADDLDKSFPEDTSVKFSYLPVLRAFLALGRHQPSKAIEVLEIAGPYELGTPRSTLQGFFGALYPVYVRGEAYLAAGKGPEAIAEFQKILNHRGIVISDTIGALAHLQIARAYALAGDNTKAKSAYQDFLTLWKDADPDIPILQQAKAEYAKLQ